MKPQDVVELAPGLWSIGQKKGGRVHAFLCDDGNELTLVDTLFDTDGKRVLTMLDQLGKRPADVRHIVITHGHRSHMGGLAALADLTGATVYSHAWEADIVSGDRKAQAVSIIPKKPLRVYFPFQFGLALGFGAHPPRKVDNTVAAGDRIGPLHVLDTPGHSPGHLAFWWPERRALLAGDAIATWPSFLPGWPSFTLNERVHRASLHQLAELEPELLGVGHGDPILSGARAKVRDLVDAIDK
jgi:glyoxylase-like metal-dependent hydrolase (beta-lactamase superfamily II)